jgi:FkbM family methyltransferase
MEIGSLHGNDMKLLQDRYPSANFHIIEAHPVYAKRIKQKYPQFNVYEFAATDRDQIVTFHGVNDEIKNQGISSMHERRNVNYTKYEVEGKRMDTFLNSHSFYSLDIVKIDVEGHSLEVLESFGNRLKHIKCIHIENEHIPVWTDQKVYAEVEKFLVEKGFILVSIKAAWPQTDSVWFHKDFYRPSWWR